MSFPKCLIGNLPPIGSVGGISPIKALGDDNYFISFIFAIKHYHPSTHANKSGATILASLSMINLGVFTSSFPHVIFSFGTAPE